MIENKIVKQKPTLYLFVGCPGAGKTTLAKFIAKQTGAYHIWADQERQKMFTYPTHSIQESQTLYKALDIKADMLLKSGQSVVFDTNFNYRRDRDLLRSIAEKNGAQTKLIWLNVSPEIAKVRALHHTHRDRNGYLVAMTEAEFNHLCDHLEPPEEDEHPIKIDTTDIKQEQLVQHFSALDKPTTKQY